MKNNKNFINRFDIIFFSFAAILILIISFRLHEFTPANAISTFLLVGTAPFLYRYIEKHHGEEKKVQTKLETIDKMTEKELANRIASIYTGRGFAIQNYDSPNRGIHMVCKRKGVRNGKNFLEKGLVLVIHTEDVVEYHEFTAFLSEISSLAATQGMMVTNSRFSPEIVDEAEKQKIALWSRSELREKFHL